MPDGNDEIKSALDIAMERAQRLGSISAEESRRIEEDELAKAGEALVKRYMRGLPLRDIEVELRRRGENERKTVVRLMLSGLVSSIELKYVEQTEKALAAVQHFSGEEDTVQGIRNLISEYRDAVEKAHRENAGALEAAKMKELEQRGISGSAIRPAIETSPDWLKIQQQLDSQYQARLAEIKGSLRQSTG